MRQLVEKIREISNEDLSTIISDLDMILKSKLEDDKFYPTPPTQKLLESVNEKYSDFVMIDRYTMVRNIIVIEIVKRFKNEYNG